MFNHVAAVVQALKARRRPKRQVPGGGEGQDRGEPETGKARPTETRRGDG